MNQTKMTLAEFVSRYGITMKCERAIKNPHMEDGKHPMDHWYCTLRNAEGAIMGLHFSMGTGLRKLAPGRKITPFKQWAGGRINRENPNALRAEYKRAYDAHLVPVPPKVKELLSCLASDASGMSDSFENWASEYGYDTDSRKAYATYEATRSQTLQLKGWLGDNFKVLLEEVELE